MGEGNSAGELRAHALESRADLVLLLRLASLNAQGELEDAVKDLGFKRTFILHPGLLVGARDHTRTLEGAAQGLFKGLRAVGFPLLDRAGVDAEV